MKTKNYKDLCPTIQTRIVFFGDFLVNVGSFFLATILVCLVGQKIFGLHFGRNVDLLNSF